MPPTKSPSSSSHVSLKDVEAARTRLKGLALRTPLIRLDDEAAGSEIYLKLENLQPTGSFKVRGAGNAISLLSPADRKRGVYTCSARACAMFPALHVYTPRFRSAGESREIAFPAS